MAADRELTPIASEVWSRLGRHDLRGEELVADNSTPQRPGRLLAAIDAVGRRHFLVQLEPAESPLEDRRSLGIEIHTRSLSPLGGLDGRYLDIVCLEASGFDVFDALGGELALVLASGAEEPAPAARRLVGKWRRFWRPQADPGPTHEERLGFFGELWFLAYWLIPAISPLEAVRAWRGPHRARHDFELQNISIESKATTSRHFRKHEVHGIEQLAPPDNGRLLVFSIRLAEERGGANTLSAVVQRLRELVAQDDEATTELETSLAAAQISEELLQSDSLRLRVVDERLYRVEGNFPRIVPGSFPSGAVPAGVGEVAYTVDLSGFDEYVVATSPAAFPAMLREWQA